MSLTAIHFKIVGTSPYSQSRQVELVESKRADESHDEFDERTWRLKAQTGPDGDSIVIPAHGMHQAIVEGAKRGRLLPSARKKQTEVLHSRLAQGIMLTDDLATDMKLSQAQKVALPCDAKGKRGAAASSRVIRRFPVWQSGWAATFDVMLLDETLTIEDLTAAVRWAGLVAGLGRFRPANGGHNGRFNIESATATDMHTKAAA